MDNRWRHRALISAAVAAPVAFGVLMFVDSEPVAADPLEECQQIAQSWLDAHPELTANVVCVPGSPDFEAGGWAHRDSAVIVADPNQPVDPHRIEYVTAHEAGHVWQHGFTEDQWSEYLVIRGFGGPITWTEMTEDHADVVALSYGYDYRDWNPSRQLLGGIPNVDELEALRTAGLLP